MSKSYLIQWKSLLNGSSGKGTKLFDLQAAQLLANELNQEYPGIQHEVLEAGSHTEPGPEVQQQQPPELSEPGSESPQVTHAPDPALAFR
jgi:hypothetical protein